MSETTTEKPKARPQRKQHCVYMDDAIYQAMLNEARRLNRSLGKLLEDQNRHLLSGKSEAA
jgi:hypothetical protein